MVHENWEKLEARVASPRPVHLGYKRQGTLNTWFMVGEIEAT